MYEMPTQIVSWGFINQLDCRVCEKYSFTH